MQRLTPDKSPGPDGVTNRMLRSGGELFNTILHEVIATQWEHQAQPSEWQKSLMQPIYKGGKKPKPDPASYRGIYLSNALAKLFEGIIIKRLTQYTEQHSTAHLQTTNLAQGQNAKSMTLSTPSLPQSNTTSLPKASPHTSHFPSIFPIRIQGGVIIYDARTKHRWKNVACPLAQT